MYRFPKLPNALKALREYFEVCFAGQVGWLRFPMDLSATKKFLRSSNPGGNLKTVRPLSKYSKALKDRRSNFAPYGQGKQEHAIASGGTSPPK